MMNIDCVMQDCLDYANRYRCSLRDAISDWDGDGPSGGWGLNIQEKDAIKAQFRAAGFPLDVAAPFDD